MSQFKADAKTMNAMTSAMGALVFAVVRRLPAEQQLEFAADLARMAAAAEKRGDPVLETMLIDLHNAARAAV